MLTPAASIRVITATRRARTSSIIHRAPSTPWILNGVEGGVINVVIIQLAGSARIRIRYLKILAPASWAKVSSTFGMGKLLS